MMRSMYAGISGLSMHQVKMDVIGNNIANVNTVGYKKSVTSFQEAYNQLIQGSSAPQDGKGGINPQQIGLGMQISAINTVYTQGTMQMTGNPEDMMINGDGFFMVSADSNIATKYYTRAGNFTKDTNGNLVTPSGYKVLGHYIGGDDYAKALGIDKDKELDGIVISNSIIAPATSSVKVEVKGNLDSRTPIADDPATADEVENQYKTDAIIKDSLGNSYKVEMAFVKTATANEWEMKMPPKVTDVSTGKELTGVTATGTKDVTFDTEGKLTTATPQITLDLSGAGTAGKFGADPATSTLTIDYSKLQQFANDSDASGKDVEVNGQIGRESGSYKEYYIDSTGKVIVSFSNGTSKAIWQLKTAKFDNNMGLIKAGSNMYKSSPNTGEAAIGNPGSGGLGVVMGSCLEMSNVDLSAEFTEMITTQRGFQANSRIITTSDEMLQELTNLKR